VRAGAALVVRTSQQVFASGNLLLLEPPDDLQAVPIASVALGVEHRFGDHILLAGELAMSVTVDEGLLALTAEVVWAWY
jgi:hypothetical protein